MHRFTGALNKYIGWQEKQDPASPSACCWHRPKLSQIRSGNQNLVFYINHGAAAGVFAGNGFPVHPSEYPLFADCAGPIFHYDVVI
jgi:hypothetical protein